MLCICLLFIHLFLFLPVQNAEAQSQIPFSKKEIESAPEYELEFLQNLLGIESRNLLMDALLGTAEDPSENESESDKQSEIEAVTRIDIQHADEIQYITAEKTDIVMFSGGVRLLYSNNGKETAFHAEYLLYDNAAGILAASGEVQLMPPDAETAAGTILFYNLKTDQGVLFSAETDYTLLENAKSESRSVRIRGDSIEFDSEAGLHIKNGTITAAGDETYLSITTDAMHLLKDGDWAVRNAMLYIGNIPVFFAPVFFYPGRRLISNPSAGIDEERGLFLQNTLYLKGAPDISAESDALFAGSEPSGQQSVWLKDTYSRSYTKAASLDSAEQKKIDAEHDDYFKIYWDVYGDPEVHAGFDLFYEQTGFLRNASAKGGITIGKNRFPRLGENVPFGAYLDASGTAETERAAVSIELPFYSDQYLARDMLNRFEKFSIRNFYSPVEWNAEYTRMHNLEWSVTTEAEQIEFGRNGTHFLQIDDADAHLIWTNSSSSERSYTPYKLVLPAVSYSLKGPIVSYSHGSDGENKTAGSAEINASEIWSERLQLEPDLFPAEGMSRNQTNQEESVTGDSDKNGLQLLKNIPLDQAAVPADETRGSLFSLSSNYQLSHDFSLYTLYGEEPRMYSGNSSVRGSIDLENTLFNDFLIADLRISPRWNAALRLRENGMPANELDAAVKDASYLQTEGEISAALPQIGTRYALKADLYKNYYLDNQYDVHRFSFSEESVNEHSISYQLKHGFPYSNASSLFTAAAELPPMEPALTLSEKIGNSRSSLLMKTMFSESEDDKRWGLSSFTAAFQYADSDVSGKNTLLLNAEEGYFRNETEMNAELFDKSLVFSAETHFTDKDRNSAELDEMVISVSAENTKLTLINGMHESGRLDAERSFRLKRGILDSVIRFEAGSGRKTYAENGTENIPDAENEIKKETQDENGPANDKAADRDKTASVTASGLFDLFWELDFIAPEDSMFKFKSEMYFEIADFLAIGFSSVSSNKRIGSYLNADSESKSTAGMFMKDFFVNLAKSFNFFNKQDRLESDFNIESYAVDIVHMMPDWDFHLQVDGKLALMNRTWVWDPKVSVFLQWKIFPEIQLDKNIDF